MGRTSYVTTLKEQAKREITNQRAMLKALDSPELKANVRTMEAICRANGLTKHMAINSCGTLYVTIDVSELDGFRDKKLTRVLSAIEAHFPFDSTHDNPEARTRNYTVAKGPVRITVYAQLKETPLACKVIETEVTETVTRIVRTFECNEIKQEVVNAHA